MRLRSYFPATPTRSSNQRRQRGRRRNVLVQGEALECRTLLTAVAMTDYEQLLLELINRGRADPTAEAARHGIGLNQGIGSGTISTDPKQPLTPNQFLLNAADGHSQDMLDRDFFAHTNPSGVTFSQRIVGAGYTPYQTIGENIATVGTTGTLNQEQAVVDSHHNLFLSVSGHRQAMLNPAYREAGTGVRFGVYTDGGTNFNSIMATENFGTQAGDAFITGVVYTDSDVDGMYSVGESIRAGTISATNTTTGVTYSDDIGISGGYRVAVPDGSYSITASYSIGATGYLSVVNVTMAGQNLKADFETGSVTPVSLSLSAPTSSVDETGAGNSVTVTLTRNGDLGSAVVFTVTNPDATELTVPATVSIPAGQATVDLSVTAFDDILIDGDQITTLTASFAAYQNGTIPVTTVDTTVPLLPSSVTESTTARPTFTWTAVSNAVTYQLWVNNSSGGVVINQSGIATTSFTPSADMDLGTHYAWVRGTTAGAVNSAWSPISVWRVRTRATVLNSGTIPTDDFTINWTTVPGATNYDVWVNRLTSGTSQYYRNTAVTTNSVGVADFAPGRYGIWVLAQNATGANGFWSTMALVTVSVPVNGVQVTAASITAAPTLSWNPVTGASNYDVWVDNTSTGAAQVVRDTSVAGTSLALSTLSAGSYRAWIRARDEFGGNYAWSSAFDFEFQQPSQPLSPAGSGQGNSPLFTWTAVSGATRYELWVSNLDGSGLVIHRENLTSTSYNPTEFLAAGNYRIWVRAFDGTGATTGWSSSLDFSVASAAETGDPEDGILPPHAADLVFVDGSGLLTLLDILPQRSNPQPAADPSSTNQPEPDVAEISVATRAVTHESMAKPVGLSEQSTSGRAVLEANDTVS
jgi:hypothetical protein